MHTAVFLAIVSLSLCLSLGTDSRCCFLSLSFSHSQFGARSAIAVPCAHCCLLSAACCQLVTYLCCSLFVFVFLTVVYFVEACSAASGNRSSNSSAGYKSPYQAADTPEGGADWRRSLLAQVHQMFDLDQSGYIDGAELKQLGQMRRQLGQKSGVRPFGVSLCGPLYHSSVSPSGISLSSVSPSGISLSSVSPSGISLSGVSPSRWVSPSVGSLSGWCLTL